MTPSSIYEERLTTLSGTRLIYNTMDELEDMLDCHSIHNNSIRRCFSSLPKMRAAYRDLKIEVEEMTNGSLDLDRVITHYKRAWAFFRDHLYRRANPEQVALELLSFCYPPHIRENLSPKKQAIYEQIVKQDINVSFLVLMLLKVIPGYNSNIGDVTDMPAQFERVMALLERFTASGTMFALLPAITKAREETNKSRLMLLDHVERILDTYESYTAPANLYDTADNIKSNCYNLDIVGLWNECDGKALTTEFWQIEDAQDYGSYFMTHWHKDAGNRITGTRYSLFIIEGEDDDLVYYLVHPEAIEHRMRGQAYGDADHVWYRTAWLEDTPAVLPLQRMMNSKTWPQKIHLTRCVDEEVLAAYNGWLQHDCQVVKPYKHLEYVFLPGIYAITHTHIYVSSEQEGEYYKVPKTAHEGFECIRLTDNVGLMTMGGKTYLAFDELMLYISTEEKELQRYDIEKVSSID